MTPTVGGPINETFFEIYDTTVQQALSSGPDVYVIVDLVRSNGKWHISFSECYHSTTTHAGTVRSLAKEVRPMTNSPTSGLKWPRSTQATPTLLYATRHFNSQVNFDEIFCSSVS